MLFRFRALEQLNIIFRDIAPLKNGWLHHDIKKYVTASNNTESTSYDVKYYVLTLRLRDDVKK